VEEAEIETEIERNGNKKKERKNILGREQEIECERILVK
jgi:hypothetical protein